MKKCVPLCKLTMTTEGETVKNGQKIEIIQLSKLREFKKPVRRLGPDIVFTIFIWRHSSVTLKYACEVIWLRKT